MSDNNLSKEELPGKEPAGQDISNHGNDGKDYSVGVLTVISLVVISILLLFGTGVGNLLNVRRVHAQLETQQAAERYRVGDVLKSIRDSEITAPARAYDAAMVDDVCQVMAISSGDLESPISVKKKHASMRFTWTERLGSIRNVLVHSVGATANRCRCIWCAPVTITSACWGRSA